MKKEIINTEKFKNLEEFKKNIYSSKKNIDKIVNLYEISCRMGFEYMMSIHKPNHTTIEIIKELLVLNNKL